MVSVAAVAREFFLIEDRNNLPIVPACQGCRRHQQGLLLAGKLPVRPGARLRRLQVAEHEAALGSMDGRFAPTLRAISSSVAPASAASKICARLSLRTARLPPLRSAVSSQRSVWLSSTHSVHSSVPPARLRHGRTTESDGRREFPRKNLHAQTGSIFGVHPPVHAPASPASSRSRHAAIFSSHPAFRSPDGGNARTRRLRQKATEGRPQHRTAR
jgi:hypothetical protein